MDTERPDDARDAGEVTEEAGGAVPPRRRSPLAVASVAAAVLLVAGGGAYLAATTSGGAGGPSAPGGDGTPPALALDGHGAGGGPGDGPGIAVGEPDPYGMTYRATGVLPDGPTSAPVYRVTGEVTRDEVARLARALDVSGTPKPTGGAWTVGVTKDGSEPVLRVSRQAPGTWTFSRYPYGSDNRCTGVTSCASRQDSARPVSEAAAKKAAAPVLKAVGQDGAVLDTRQVMGSLRVVNADPTIGGLPTQGWSTGVQVAADGRVVGGSGNLKAPVKGAVYPVVDAKRTLDLMNGAPPSYGRKGVGGCASPVPLKDRDEAPCGASTGAPKPASTPVLGAVFGLARHSVDARAVLVPSWLFEVRPAGARDTLTVAYPAVDPQYLTVPQPPGQPRETPAPRTDGAGDGAGDRPAPAPTKRDVKVMGYTADGKDLTVAYQGGVCADYAASVREGSDRVTVTVTETPWPGKVVCIAIAKIYHETLHLKASLGDREVVGSDGKPIARKTPGAPPFDGAGPPSAR